MPTYDYECDSCGYTFEEFQSFKDDPLTKCPKCKRPKLRRLFGTGAAVLFKGSGFYETDYRSESYKAGEKADKAAAEKPATTENTPSAPTNGTTTPSADKTGSKAKGTKSD